MKKNLIILLVLIPMLFVACVKPEDLIDNNALVEGTWSYTGFKYSETYTFNENGSVTTTTTFHDGIVREKTGRYHADGTMITILWKQLRVFDPESQTWTDSDYLETSYITYELKGQTLSISTILTNGKTELIRTSYTKQ